MLAIEQKISTRDHAKNVVYSILSAMIKTGIWVYDAYTDHNNNATEKNICVFFGFALIIAQTSSNIALWREKKLRQLNTALQDIELSPSKNSVASQSQERHWLDNDMTQALYESTLLAACIIKGVLTSWSFTLFLIFLFPDLAFLRKEEMFWWTLVLFPYLPFNLNLTKIALLREEPEQQMSPRYWSEFFWQNFCYLVRNIFWFIAFIIEKSLCLISGPGISQAVAQIGPLASGFSAKKTVLMGPVLIVIKKYFSPIENLPVANAFTTLVYTRATFNVINKLAGWNSTINDGAGTINIHVTSWLVGLTILNFLTSFLGVNEGWLHKTSKVLDKVADPKTDDYVPVKPCGVLRLFQYLYSHMSFNWSCKKGGSLLTVMKLTAYFKSFESGASAALLLFNEPWKMHHGEHAPWAAWAWVIFIPMTLIFTVFAYHFEGSVNTTGRDPIEFDRAFFASFTRNSLLCCIHKPLTADILVQRFGGVEKFQKNFPKTAAPVRERIVESFRVSQDDSVSSDSSNDRVVEEVLQQCALYP